MKRLDVINAMLISMEQAPVSSIDSTHPLVITALSVFDGVDMDVQAHGWWFNKDWNVTLTPDSTGAIVLPETILSVDPVNPYVPFLQRGGKLYDPYTQTSKFTDPVVVNLISRVAFEDLPEAAAKYIQRRSVYEYFLSFDGEANKLQHLATLMESSRATLNAEQMRVLRTNVVDSAQYLQLVGRFATPSDGRISVRRRHWHG